MLTLFQIGNTPLHGYLERRFEHDLEATGKTTTLVDSPAVLRAQSPFISKPRKFRSDVLAYTDEYRTKDMLYQQLATLIGRDTDIIAYDDMSAHVDVSRDPESRLQINTGQLLWLQTRGQITEIEPAQRDMSFTFRVEVETDTYWMPLDPILWKTIEATVSNVHYLNEQSLTAPFIANKLPSARALTRMFKKRPEMFHRTIMSNWGAAFDDDYYETRILTPANTPWQIGIHTNWSTDAIKQIPVYIDSSIWGIPPRNIYVFRNLPATGTITIQVERQNQYRTETITTTIDLATLDTNMTTAGYTTTATDKLVVGDTHWSPGFMLRDSTKLIQIADAVTQNGGDWVGQLLTGHNTITITVPSGVEWFLGSINRRV